MGLFFWKYHFWVKWLFGDQFRSFLGSFQVVFGQFRAFRVISGHFNPFCYHLCVIFCEISLYRKEKLKKAGTPEKKYSMAQRWKIWKAKEKVKEAAKRKENIEKLKKIQEEKLEKENIETRRLENAERKAKGGKSYRIKVEPDKVYFVFSNGSMYEYEYLTKKYSEVLET